MPRVRPEVEAFIAIARCRGIPWEELWLGKAERLYDHLAQHLPGIDPIRVAERLNLTELRLYGAAAETVYHVLGEPTAMDRDIEAYAELRNIEAMLLAVYHGRTKSYKDVGTGGYQLFRHHMEQALAHLHAEVENMAQRCGIPLEEVNR